MHCWKCLTSTTIQEFNTTQWQMTCVLYGNMELYKRTMSCETKWIWWELSKKNTTCTKSSMMLLRLLGGDRIHISDDRRDKCCISKNSITCKTTHILFECDKLKPQRDRSWVQVLDAMPQSMSEDIARLSPGERAFMVASGLNVNVVDEWLDIYSRLSMFVKDMYTMAVKYCEEIM